MAGLIFEYVSEQELVTFPYCRLMFVLGHEDCFMDVPRLSTVQAMMILIKARESAPKRGYYYRSWITIKKIITMAHDLDLHEHYDQHKQGISCGSDPTECLIKTRIWQTLFILEVMVGAPQGKHLIASSLVSCH